MEYGILPCALNLKRWKKKNTDKRDICNNTENVIHLIYECQYAKSIWSKVEKALNISLGPSNIILGHNLEQNIVLVTSLITYLIYKEWVNLSINKKKRQVIPNLKRYACDLEYKKQVYSKTNKMSQYENILDLVTSHLLD